MRHKFNRDRGFIPIINDEEFENEEAEYDLDNIEINNVDSQNKKINE